MLPFRYNLVLFAFVGGVIAAIELLLGGEVLDLWVYPVAFVLTWNAINAYRERAGTAQMVNETDMEQLFSGLGWGFIAVLLALPVVMTYRLLNGGSVSNDLAWVVLPGIGVTFATWAVYELQSRRA